MGYTVYAAARRTERMVHLADAGVRTVRVDVTDDSSLTSFVEQVLAETGRIDVLVNNAGYGCIGALEDVPMTEARRQFDVNLFGLARLVQPILPAMRAQGGGRVINVSSIGGKIYGPVSGWYHAAKFAVEGLSDCLRLELAPFGIHVVLIEPGAIHTEWGTIAARGLIEASGDGVYADQAAGVAKVHLAADDGTGQFSSPEVVADVIARAVGTRRPSARYPIGKGARPLVVARRVLPDRAFDRAMRLVFRTGGAAAARTDQR